MLDPGTAQEIADRFDLGSDAALSGPAAKGKLGQVWELTTPRGRFAVKESFGPFEERDGEDAAFSEAARAVGVPTPEVLRVRDGSLIVPIGDDEIRLFGWVDLLEPDPGADPAEVGSTVAALHRVPFQGARGVHPWYFEPVGGERWDGLVRDLRRARAPFAEDLAAYRDELVAMEELIEPPDALRTCHRDLWADNLRITAGGGLCVIDWDNCGLADPSQELALVLFEFSGGDAARARALHESYLGGGGTGAVDGRGNFSMAIAQLGHIGETAARRWLDSESEPDRAENEAWFRELVDRPLTRRGIDELLDAVTR
ncbi:MAG: phosphotransferase enzyme family protein [Actinomycetota bacterium]